jgi:RNA polymerase sigma-70 factor (ECF subfamily)
MNPPPTATADPHTLARARDGDADAFERLVEPHRPSLHAHCYRMLGSVHDADDALQEALLRAWKGIARFEGRSAPRSWLHRIATNACLDAIARRRKRVLPIDYGPPGPGGDDREALEQTIWIEPYPDSRLEIGDPAPPPEARYEEREALELAFVAALQRLPLRQRGALILRDVLGFSAREVAEALETTPASINSALQRARKTIDRELPEQSQQATMRALGDAAVRAVVERFVDAFERGDVEAILELLAEDVTFAMPPYPGWQRGREAVGESWLMPSGPPPRLRYVSTRANGQPALGTYALADDDSAFLPIALDVLALREDGKVAQVLAFRTPGLCEAFGLPARMPR